jgi:plasmid replication initiation protein
LAKERRVLAISPDYFKLDGGLERRLYQLARKHVGKQRQWRIGLPLLAQKVGSAQQLRFFKRDLKRVIDADSIPDYRFQIEGEVLEMSEEFKAELREAGQLRAVNNERLVILVTPKAKRPSPALLEA